MILVRSQDKRVLIEADRFKVEHTSTNMWCINSNDGAVLGFYNLEEKALEVLDDIARFIRAHDIRHTKGEIWVKTDMFIFLMPKDNSGVFAQDEGEVFEDD